MAPQGIDFDAMVPGKFYIFDVAAGGAREATETETDTLRAAIAAGE